MEGKVCHILDANNEGGGRQTPHQRLAPPTTIYNQWARAFIDRERALHAEIAQSAFDSHLKIGHRWSDQCHLDRSKYS